MCICIYVEFKNTVFQRLGYYRANMGVRACCVPGCKSGKKMPSHRFPKKMERRIQWFQGLQMTPVLEENKIEKLRVCYKHFHESDYNNTLVRRVLLCTAVPSVYIPEKNIERIISQDSIDSRSNVIKYAQFILYISLLFQFI